MKIHLTGAAGTGTSTLGRALAAEQGLPFVDTDAFYWLPTNPPFTDKRAMPERLERLQSTLAESPDGYVLSGSLMDWGDPLIPDFDLVVFLYVEPAERLRRLHARELRRFGPLIEQGGPLHAKHLNFLEWASGYETGALGGRSLANHTAWLANLPCPVLKIEGNVPRPEALARAMAALPKPL